MSASPIDYAAIAKQYGAIQSSNPNVDYAAIAKQFGSLEGQTQQTQQQPEQPGFFKRLGQSFGLPTSMDELRQMQANEENLPMWQRALPHVPGSAPSAGMSAATAALGPIAPVVASYAQTAGRGLKEGIKEGYEAGQQLGRGEITPGQAAGKAGYGALHGILQATPIVGPSIETSGEDVAQGNLRGAVGGLTGVVGQVAAPKMAGKLSANSPLGRMLLLGKTPEAAYESALKPSTVLRPSVREGLAPTALSEGIPVSQSGIEKLSGLIDQVNNQISQTVATRPKAPISPQAATQPLAQTRATFANQVNPNSDLAAIDAAQQEFLQNNPSLTAEQAQSMKQGTYRALGNKAYGELKGASVEAQKALARGLKDELANQFPELNDLNARDGRLLDLQDSLERAVNRIGNHQAVGIGTPIAAAGVRAVTNSNKLAAVAGFMKAVLDNPNVKSRLAIALSQGKIPSPMVVPKIAGYAGALGRLSQPSTLPFLPGSSQSRDASGTQAPQ